jgi:hypothetical protein
LIAAGGAFRDTWRNTSWFDIVDGTASSTALGCFEMDTRDEANCTRIMLLNFEAVDAVFAEVARPIADNMEILIVRIGLS